MSTVFRINPHRPDPQRRRRHRTSSSPDPPRSRHRHHRHRHDMQQDQSQALLHAPTPIVPTAEKAVRSSSHRALRRAKRKGKTDPYASHKPNPSRNPFSSSLPSSSSNLIYSIVHRRNPRYAYQEGEPESGILRPPSRGSSCSRSRSRSRSNSRSRRVSFADNEVGNDPLQLYNSITSNNNLYLDDQSASSVRSTGSFKLYDDRSPSPPQRKHRSFHFQSPLRMDEGEQEEEKKKHRRRTTDSGRRRKKSEEEPEDKRDRHRRRRNKKDKVDINEDAGDVSNRRDRDREGERDRDREKKSNKERKHRKHRLNYLSKRS